MPHNNSSLTSILCVITGLFLWTVYEYLGHRYLFHGEDTWMHYVPQNKWVYTGHFMVHGIHHAFPQDRMRLTFPPVPGYFLIWLVIYFPLSFVIPTHLFHTIFLGALLGYQLYDEMHYFMHHSSPEPGYFRNMKLYHMQHHYKFGTIGFGVSSKFWDLVFKSDIPMDNKGKAKSL